MKISIKRLVSKILKITGIAIGSILLLMFLLPMLFPDFVAGKIKLWANDVITTKLDFSKARLSFFKHFPSLTLTLYDLSLMGSEPYPTDTLLNADEVALGIDLSTLFSSRIRIDQIFFTKGLINIKLDENGIDYAELFQCLLFDLRCVTCSERIFGQICGRSLCASVNSLA